MVQSFTTRCRIEAAGQCVEEADLRPERAPQPLPARPGGSRHTVGPQGGESPQGALPLPSLVPSGRPLRDLLHQRDNNGLWPLETPRRIRARGSAGVPDHVSKDLHVKLGRFAKYGLGQRKVLAGGEGGVMHGAVLFGFLVLLAYTVIWLNQHVPLRRDNLPLGKLCLSMEFLGDTLVWPSCSA